MSRRDRQMTILLPLVEVRSSARPLRFTSWLMKCFGDPENVSLDCSLISRRLRVLHRSNRVHASVRAASECPEGAIGMDAELGSGGWRSEDAEVTTRHVSK